MNWLILVIALVVMQFFFFGALVSRARAQYAVAAPATQGSDAYNRINRVHLNTLERLALLLPLMWAAAQYWRPEWVAVLGLVFLLGRFAYWRGYVKSPDARHLGTIFTMLPIGVLLIASLVGVAQALLKA